LEEHAIPLRQSSSCSHEHWIEEKNRCQFILRFASPNLSADSILSFMFSSLPIRYNHDVVGSIGSQLWSGSRHIYNTFEEIETNCNCMGG
jgi:hypothetical protein